MLVGAASQATICDQVPAAQTPPRPVRPPNPGTCAAGPTLLCVGVGEVVVVCMVEVGVLCDGDVSTLRAVAREEEERGGGVTRGGRGKLAGARALPLLHPTTQCVC